jgi:hypothetical protein
VWQTILDDNVRWDLHVPSHIAFYTLELFFKLNKHFTTEHERTNRRHSITVSKGNEYLAVLTVSTQLPNRILVDIYETGTTTFRLVRNAKIIVQPPTNIYEDCRDLQGTISTDGMKALVFLRTYVGDSLCFCTLDGGKTWAPFSLKGKTCWDLEFFAYDAERVFFRRRGEVFRKGGQVVIIDAYSAETWNYARSWSFGMGDGFALQNISLLPAAGSVGKPILVAISADLGPGHPRPSHRRCIVCSSTGQQYYLEGMECDPGRTWVSPDTRYLAHRTRDTDRAELLLWDMTRPTFRPLARIPLPDVQEANQTATGLNGSLHKPPLADFRGEVKS